MHATQSASVMAKSISCFKWFWADNGSDMQTANASPLKKNFVVMLLALKLCFEISFKKKT